MRFLKVKITVGQKVFGKLVVEREIITRIPCPSYQDEDGLKLSLRKGYADILGKDLSEIKVELL